MVLITQTTSEGSGEPAHPCSLARAFAVRTQSMEVDEGSDQTSNIWPHWKAAHVRFKEFTEDEKYHNLMRWLKIGYFSGIQALRSVLNPFSVNNRKNMFVIKETSGRVCYLRLKEFEGSSKLPAPSVDENTGTNKSSPEPKAHWWAYSIGRPLSSLGMCVCVFGQHFQMCSPLKPLGWMKPNFMWRLLGMGERKFIQTVQVTWQRWPPCPLKSHTCQIPQWWKNLMVFPLILRSYGVRCWSHGFWKNLF